MPANQEPVLATVYPLEPTPLARAEGAVAVDKLRIVDIHAVDEIAEATRPERNEWYAAQQLALHGLEVQVDALTSVAPTPDSDDLIAIKVGDRTIIS